jgi:hypothetical protein
MLTPPLAEVLSTIIDWQRRTGDVPTLREIAEVVAGTRYPSAIHRSVKILEARGFLTSWRHGRYVKYYPVDPSPRYFKWDDEAKALRPLPGFHGFARLGKVEIPLEVEPELRPVAEVAAEQDSGLGGHAAPAAHELVEPGRQQP